MFFFVENCTKLFNASNYNIEINVLATLVLVRIFFLENFTKLLNATNFNVEINVLANLV